MTFWIWTTRPLDGAATINPLPIYMPTWWMGLPKNTRSPGSRALWETCGIALYWAAAECGRSTPAALHEYMVSPEQSNELGPAAPQTYGLPSWASAVWTATEAAPVGDGRSLGSGTERGSPICERRRSSWLSLRSIWSLRFAIAATSLAWAALAFCTSATAAS